MPIYEFYCPDCHTVFSFFSSRVDPSASPACPRCSRPNLGRRPSRFAVGSARRSEEPDAEGLPAGLDEERFGSALERVFGELPPGAEDDPRAMASLLRTFSEQAGMDPGPKMEEMLRRLEAGEDPDQIEEDLGGSDDEGGENLEDFFQSHQQLRTRKAAPPKIDRELYFL